MYRFLVELALDIPNTQPRYNIQVDRVVSIAAQKSTSERDSGKFHIAWHSLYCPAFLRLDKHIVDGGGLPKAGISPHVRRTTEIIYVSCLVLWEIEVMQHLTYVTINFKNAEAN